MSKIDFEVSIKFRSTFYKWLFFGRQNSESAIRTSKVEKIRTPNLSIKVIGTPKVTYLWRLGLFKLTLKLTLLNLT
jgi:hypothetical protein